MTFGFYTNKQFCAFCNNIFKIIRLKFGFESFYTNKQFCAFCNNIFKIIRLKFGFENNF